MSSEHRFRDLSMMKKMLIAPSLIIVLLLLFGFVSYLGLSQQKKALHDIYAVRFKSYQSSSTVVKDLNAVHANVYRLLSWEVARYERARIDALGTEQLATLERSVNAMKSGAGSATATEEEQRIYQTILADLLEYQKAIASAIDLSSSDLNLSTMYMGTADEKFRKLEKIMKELLELETRMSEDTHASALRTFRRRRNWCRRSAHHRRNSLQEPTRSTARSSS